MSLTIMSSANIVLSLPELLFYILPYLPLQDVCNAREVNRQWKAIVDGSQGLLYSPIPSEMLEIPKKYKLRKNNRTSRQPKVINSLLETPRSCMSLLDNISISLTTGFTRTGFDASHQRINSVNYLINDQIINLSTLGSIPVIANGSHPITKFDVACGLCRTSSIRTTELIHVSDKRGVSMGTLLEVFLKYIRHNLAHYCSGVWPRSWETLDDRRYKYDFQAVLVFKFDFITFQLNPNTMRAVLELAMRRVGFTRTQSFHETSKKVKESDQILSKLQRRWGIT